MLANSASSTNPGRVLHSEYEARLLKGHHPITNNCKSPSSSTRSASSRQPPNVENCSQLQHRGSRPNVTSPTTKSHPSSAPRRSKCVYSDRFIPSRTASNLETTFDLLPDMAYPSSKRTQLHPPTNPPPTKNQGDLSLLLQREYLGVDASLASSKPFFDRRVATDPRQSSATTRRNLFRFQSPRDHLSCSFPTTTPLLKRNPLAATSPPLAKQRKIAKSPFKILDAPALQDDFYLNLVDWSSMNILAVGLGSAVYLWSSCTSKVTKLCELGTMVTSVAWSSHGTHLAIGTHHGDVQLWDAVLCLRIRVMTGHTERVGTLAWNSTVLASGSRDKTICLRDPRCPLDVTSTLQGHKQEICGLKWSFDNTQLASGGNDNKVHASPAAVFPITVTYYRSLILYQLSS
ncbi:hypothetical protein, variant [Aphanomyces astaci]|uniref:Anaphase-promoting complex subunit 4-like WD40 domain-containing protein n=1 Tax=Aphanomyces astaci TaxID=112090 RepID=W4GTQ5_APHAT|nr:hypothetical protein, variant [Aphanomyces astaci]ETV83057.1 hypothetical protein, variant [Aphanomyces astaci]|eukprot:XP_009827728.1 hypothetical protein, variant [Aphanomyces astaci]